MDPWRRRARARRLPGARRKGSSSNKHSNACRRNFAKCSCCTNSRASLTRKSPSWQKSRSAPSCRASPARARSSGSNCAASPERKPPMDCNETRRLIDAAIDGELDLVHQLEFEAHLRTCADCARQADAARAQRTALRESLPRFTAPPALAGRIRAALLAEGAPVALAPERTASHNWIWNLSGLAACVALALL